MNSFQQRSLLPTTDTDYTSPGRHKTCLFLLDKHSDTQALPSGLSACLFTAVYDPEVCISGFIYLWYHHLMTVTTGGYDATSAQQPCMKKIYLHCQMISACLGTRMGPAKLICFQICQKWRHVAKRAISQFSIPKSVHRTMWKVQYDFHFKHQATMSTLLGKMVGNFWENLLSISFDMFERGESCAHILPHTVIYL